MKADQPTNSLPQALMMSMLSFSLVLGLQHLRPFGDNRAVVWRDIAGGMSRPGFFIATNAANLYLIAAAACVHLMFTWPLCGFQGGYGDHLFVHIMVGWAASGYSYAISLAIAPSSAQLMVTLFARCSFFKQWFALFDPTVAAL
jgi:hypothetical protein